MLRNYAARNCVQCQKSLGRKLSKSGKIILIFWWRGRGGEWSIREELTSTALYLPPLPLFRIFRSQNWNWQPSFGNKTVCFCGSSNPAHQKVGRWAAFKLIFQQVYTKPVERSRFWRQIPIHVLYFAWHACWATSQKSLSLFPSVS